MGDPILYCSGLNPETGDYTIPPCTPGELAYLAKRTTIDPRDAQAFRDWKLAGRSLYGDSRYLSQAGWGVIFAHDEPAERLAAIREALKPLLDLREEQTGGAPLFREYSGGKGYLPGDTKQAFLKRHGIAPGPAEPKRMPYYLLIVGDPQAIPYEFQYQLDAQRAVGRICFDTVEEYARYARSVVDAETSQTPRRCRRTAFFSPRNPGDPVSDLCVDRLASPLASWVETLRPEWETRRVLEDAATKASLAHLLGGDQTPDFLFTASHGAVFGPNDPRVLPHQGALMCREWPGPSFRGRFPTDFYFAGEDLDPAGRLDGLIAFLWACYSGGGPASSDFELGGKVPVAPRPFLGRLPYGLLSHPRGSALAVIGHIELVWIWSAEWPGVGKHLKEFEEMFRMLLEGYPVGAAMEPFGQRYADLAIELCQDLLDLRRDGREPTDDTAFRLCVCHDTRNYVILGDPAVRLVQPGEA